MTRAKGSIPILRLEFAIESEAGQGTKVTIVKWTRY